MKIETTSVDFAEFYGALLGDGCVYSNLNGVCISGNSELDKDYLEKYISNLIKKIFNITPKIYYSKNENSIRCLIYNRNIARFMIKMGFPKGIKKTQNPKFPKYFFKNKELLKACIRGLNDTDGSVYHQSNTKIILDICIKSPSLLESTKKAFEAISFPINSTHNRIYLCSKEKVGSFFKIIGSSNLRHIKKHEIFLKTGKVPTSLEIEKLLR